MVEKKCDTLSTQVNGRGRERGGEISQSHSFILLIIIFIFVCDLRPILKRYAIRNLMGILLKNSALSCSWRGIAKEVIRHKQKKNARSTKYE